MVPLGGSANFTHVKIFDFLSQCFSFATHGWYCECHHLIIDFHSREARDDNQISMDLALLCKASLQFWRYLSLEPSKRILE